MMKTIKTISLLSLAGSLIFLVGTATGAYVAYSYERSNTEHLGSLADRGYCAARDVDHNRYWYACQDAAVAFELQRRDAERDADVNTILSDMAKREPRAKTMKVKQ